MKMTPFSQYVWNSKYRFSQGKAVDENDICDTWKRVAAASSSIEEDADSWEREFYEILQDFRFLPGGRILAGAGTARRVTLFNCFVIGPIHDSIESILDALKETALTMQQGGGTGCDFSALRPAGTAAVASGTTSSGPVSFMHIWDALCQTLLATSERRGAMMATLRCDHPDIEAFIDAKRDENTLCNFNLSVLITDSFMKAVANDDQWELRFPASNTANGTKARGMLFRKLPARQLWQRLTKSAHATAEPGVLFIDTINRENNLHYCEQISATNPCGEIPLPSDGACNLGSINLTKFVRRPFTPDAVLDEHGIEKVAGTAVRLLDNVIDISRFPLEKQAHQARGTRRIGLGITGLADALVMLGLDYDSDKGRAAAAHTLELIRDVAYESSIDLAQEKGAFPFLDRQRFLRAPFILRLPAALRSGIADHGIRNSHLLAIAPTGTISLVAGNVSSGIEPIYALEAERNVRGRNAEPTRFFLRDYAYSMWQNGRRDDVDLPGYFVTSDVLTPLAHLEMQACVQRFVDNAISKTVNLPETATTEDVADIFSRAHLLGLKGCTVYRTGSRCGQVLRAREESHCCHLDREAD